MGFAKSKTPKSQSRQVFSVASVLSGILLILAHGVWWYSSPDLPIRVIPTSIAVIGAGPAGIAAANLLSNLAREEGVPVSITIYERNHGTGGRLILNNKNGSEAVFPFDDHLQMPLDPEDIAGQSLLHSSSILRSKAKVSGIGAGFRDSSVKLGICDGKSFLFDASRPSSVTSWSSWLGQIYRYGSSVWRSVKLPVGTMAKENKLRKLSLSSAFPYQSIEDVVFALDLTDELSMSGDERLRKNGISEKYENEMLAPETRRRLAQEVAEINDLALSMAVYDLDQGITQAGGQVIPVLEDMLVESEAHVILGTEVVGLHQELMRSGKLEWIVRLRNESRDTEYSAFQKVIIAAPWYPDTLELHAELDQQPQELEYRQRHVTFFISLEALSSELFGSEDKLPSQILPTMIAKSDKLYGIHEIAFVRDLPRVVDGKATTYHLYRILSIHKIGDAFLSSLFNKDYGNPVWVYKGSIRHAYPLLYPRTVFPPMVLSDSLWHAGALEAVASSLDMSLFAGANVGALAFAQIKKEQA